MSADIAARIAVLVEAQGAKEAGAQIKGTGEEVEVLGNTTEKTSRKMKDSAGVATLFSRSLGTVARAAKYAVGIAGVGGLAFGLKDAVDAATQMQTSQVRLAKTMQNAGISWKKNGTDVLERLEGQARKTGFAMQDITDSYGNFIRTTGSSAKALHLNSMAMDIARTHGMSLAGAQSLLARVYNGSYMGLKRLGINVIPITKNYDDLKASTKSATAEQIKQAKALDTLATRNRALNEVQSKFGGQAQAYSKTFSGAIDRLHVAVDLLEERVGKKLLPVLTSFANFLLSKKFSGAVTTAFGKVKPTIDAVIKAVESIAPVAKRQFGDFVNDAKGVVVAIKSIVSWCKQNVPALEAIGTFVGVLAAAYAAWRIKIIAVTAATKVMAAASWLLNKSFLANPVALVVIAIAALAAGLVYAYKKVGWFHDAVNTAWGILKDVFNFVKGHWQTIGEVLFGPLIPAVKLILNHLGQIVSFVKSLPRKISGAATGMWDGLKSGLGSVVKWIAGKILFLVNAYNKLPLVPNISTTGLQALAGQAAPTAVGASTTVMPGNPKDPRTWPKDYAPGEEPKDYAPGKGPSSKPLTIHSSIARANARDRDEFDVYLDGKKVGKGVRRRALSDLAIASGA